MFSEWIATGAIFAIKAFAGLFTFCLLVFLALGVIAAIGTLLIKGEYDEK